jgi:hypothetical protein
VHALSACLKPCDPSLQVLRRPNGGFPITSRVKPRTARVRRVEKLSKLEIRARNPS